ncbi:rap1 gtpase-activating protein 1 [Limosa lapponica baueri]|uniref:Rap1 gtpase-activating protein 1 n=1 Tax=Limosa lapponica baueri TaxID=1758121 RepID=A0A2I0T370_LIMLA|nr:rap1 gtpase-activating protein 1 [Limosa lapponica baueri]
MDMSVVIYGLGRPMDMGAHGPGCPMAWELYGVSTHWHGHGCLAPSLQEHFNYYSLDPALGHLVFSLKYDEQEHLHLLLRTRARTLHDVVPISCLAEFPNVVQMAKLVCEDVNVDRFYPVLYPKASRLILAFDEHVLSNHFKFGVIYQKLGQVLSCKRVAVPAVVTCVGG